MKNSWKWKKRASLLACEPNERSAAPGCRSQGPHMCTASRVRGGGGPEVQLLGEAWVAWWSTRLGNSWDDMMDGIWGAR